MTTPIDGQPESESNLPSDVHFEWEENPATSYKSGNNISLTSPLRTLKTIIWSIDWEISDQILKMLHDELNTLKEYYQDDETVIKFLQLMEAVGKYIVKRKGKSHPESVKLLREFFAELERIVFMLGMSETERNTSLQKQIDKFNALKRKLASSRKEDAAPAKTAPKVEEIIKKEALKKVPPVVVEAPPKVVPSKVKKKAPAKTQSQSPMEFKPDVFRQMLLDEMRLVIRYEFKKIKAELEEMVKHQQSADQV